MKRVELSIDIDAPPSDVWEVLTKPPAFTEWISGLQSIEMLTEGAYGVGTRYRATAGSAKSGVSWTVEISAVEHNESIDFSYSGDVEGSGGWRIDVLEGDAGCRVTSFDVFEPPGRRLIKLLSRLWLDNANRAARRDSLERLKGLVESQYEYVYEEEDEDDNE